MSWYLNESDILTHDDLATSTSGGFNYPYPATFWSLNNRRQLTLFLLPEPVGGDDVGAWYLDENNILKNVALCDELIDDTGAFSNNPSLYEVKIPSTVEFIGRRAFHNTGLVKVTLPRNCTYYSTSFPSRCTVEGGRLIE